MPACDKNFFEERDPEPHFIWVAGLPCIEINLKRNYDCLIMETNLIYSNNYFLRPIPEDISFSTVLKSEYYEGRMEQEEIVYLENGLILELKWGGPFRKEGEYRVGEKVGLFEDNTKLIVIRYNDEKSISREDFFQVRDNYYISLKL